jgi:hypothetical protein
MDADLKRLSNPLEQIMKGENSNSSNEKNLSFDNLHLSPLKVNLFNKKFIFILFLKI